MKRELSTKSKELKTIILRNTIIIERILKTKRLKSDEYLGSILQSLMLMNMQTKTTKKLLLAFILTDITKITKQKAITSKSPITGKSAGSNKIAILKEALSMKSADFFPMMNTKTLISKSKEDSMDLLMTTMKSTLLKIKKVWLRRYQHPQLLKKILELQ